MSVVFASRSGGSNEFTELKDKLKRGLAIKDRKKMFRKHRNCFLGSDAVAFLVSSGMCATVQRAVNLGNLLMDKSLLKHVTDDHAFKVDPCLCSMPETICLHTLQSTGC